MRAMGRARQFAEDTDVRYVQGNRKGTCPVCGVWGELKRRFPVFVDPFRRKPDGSLYTIDEMEEAVQDFAERWDRGPFLHHLCALEKTDVLAGFNIETGRQEAAHEVVRFPTPAEAG